MLDQTAADRSVAGTLSLVRAPGFVGRSRELAALTGALAGSPAVVLIEGEAGIGKSRLVREYLASPGGRARTVLLVTCPPFRQPHTLGPVAAAIRQAASDGARGLGLSGLAGALRPLFPEWSGDLPPVPEPAEDASAARHRVFAALAELLGRLGVSLLVVEDAHWADEASLEFLLYLAAGPRQLGLAVTCRPEDVPAGSLLLRLARMAAGSDGLRLALGPLDVAGTARLVSSMLAGEHVSDNFVTLLHERSEGVPLAVEESLRLLADRGDLTRHGGQWLRLPLEEIAVPPTVRDAVLERAGRLRPDAQAVLHAAAVLTDPASETILTTVTGLPPGRVLAGLCEVLGSGLLAEDGRGLVTTKLRTTTRPKADPLLHGLLHRARMILEAERFSWRARQDSNPRPAA
jgi:predicted ATPase